MLPDLRFVLGAAVATAILGVTALGLATTVRLAHQAKIGPLEASRSLAFAERADWDPFPDGARRFEELLRRDGGAPAGFAGQPLAGVYIPPSSFIWPNEQTRDRDDAVAPAPERAPQAALEVKPPGAVAEEPQATGTIAPRATVTAVEPAPPSEPATPAEPATTSETPAVATENPVSVAAIAPNQEALEPAGARENATGAQPQIRKPAVNKRAKRKRSIRVRQVQQHASTGYSLAPVRPAPQRLKRPAKAPPQPTGD